MKTKKNVEVSRSYTFYVAGVRDLCHGQTCLPELGRNGVGISIRSCFNECPFFFVPCVNGIVLSFTSTPTFVVDVLV